MFVVFVCCGCRTGREMICPCELMTSACCWLLDCVTDGGLLFVAVVVEAVDAVEDEEVAADEVVLLFTTETDDGLVIVLLLSFWGTAKNI